MSLIKKEITKALLHYKEEANVFRVMRRALQQRRIDWILSIVFCVRHPARNPAFLHEEPDRLRAIHNRCNKKTILKIRKLLPEEISDYVTTDNYKKYQIASYDGVSNKESVC